MASADISVRIGRLANPWWWMSLALGCCAAGWLWLAVWKQRWPGGRFTLIVVGLLATAAGVIIRLNSREPAFLARASLPRRNFFLLMLTGLFASLALALSVLLVLAFMRPGSVPWRWGPLLVVWVAVAPMSELAAVQCFRRRRQGEPLSAREEGAFLLQLAALASFAATGAMFDPDDPFAMDSIRLFLSVLTLVALTASPLVLVPQDVRRKVVSLLIVLHFAGIITATLAAYHTPKVIKQLWDRIYSPYLQFIYMTNAYHFFAPEPGEGTYLWFRIQYQNDDGTIHGTWYKMPELDENGWPTYATGLGYERYFCLAEQCTIGAGDRFFDTDENPLEFFDRRMQRAQAKTAVKVAKSAISAKDAPRDMLFVPWHPDYLFTKQYVPPRSPALVASYARHVLRQAEELPNCTIKSVKIYHVNHFFIPPDLYRKHRSFLEPDDPHTYRPVFLGEYDTAGVLIHDGDPLLYWVLPTLREARGGRAIYRSFARLHAGDPAWIRNEEGVWVEHVAESAEGAGEEP